MDKEKIRTELEQKLFTGHKAIAVTCGLIKEFRVDRYFTLDTKLSCLPHIASMNTNFKQWFWPMTEEWLQENGNTVLTGRGVRVGSTFHTEEPISSFLMYFGISRSAVTLQEIYRMILQCDEDVKKCPLLKNGHSNIFFVGQKLERVMFNKIIYHNEEGKTVEEEISNQDLIYRNGSKPHILRVISLSRYPGEDLRWSVSAYSAELDEALLNARLVFTRNPVTDTLMEPIEMAA